MGLAEVWYDRRWPRQGLTSRCATEKHPPGQPRRRDNQAASRHASPSPQPRPPPRTDHPPTPVPAPRGPCPSATFPLSAYPASTRRMRTGHAGFGGVLTVGIVTIARNLQFIPEKWSAGPEIGPPVVIPDTRAMPPRATPDSPIWLETAGRSPRSRVKKRVDPPEFRDGLPPGPGPPAPGHAAPASGEDGQGRDVADDPPTLGRGLGASQAQGDPGGSARVEQRGRDRDADR